MSAGKRRELCDAVTVVPLVGAAGRRHGSRVPYLKGIGLSFPACSSKLQNEERKNSESDRFVGNFVGGICVLETQMSCPTS